MCEQIFAPSGALFELVWLKVSRVSDTGGVHVQWDVPVLFNWNKTDLSMGTRLHMPWTGFDSFCTGRARLKIKVCKQEYNMLHKQDQIASIYFTRAFVCR